MDRQEEESSVSAGLKALASRLDAIAWDLPAPQDELRRPPEEAWPTPGVLPDDEPEFLPAA